MKILAKHKQGFSLAELLISLTILAVVIGSSAALYSQFFNSMRSTNAANTIYTEARFVMQRIVEATRQNTIDYEEYFNQIVNPPQPDPNPPNNLISTYAQNHCLYYQQFYSAGVDGIAGTADDESEGMRPTASYSRMNQIQNELYLINQTGDQKTLFKQVTDTVNGQPLGKIAILELVGRDYGNDHLDSANGCARDLGESDEKIDTWECASGYNCPLNTNATCSSNSLFDTAIQTAQDEDGNLANSSFIDITPNSLDIISLQFIVTPQEDPHKAYSNAAMQIQPQVTIKMVVQGNPAALDAYNGTNPQITLVSTIASRLYSGVDTSCPIQ